MMLTDVNKHREALLNKLKKKTIFKHNARTSDIYIPLELHKPCNQLDRNPISTVYNYHSKVNVLVNISLSNTYKTIVQKNISLINASEYFITELVRPRLEASLPAPLPLYSGIPVSNYQWYLHMSQLQEIYKLHYHFLDLMKKRYLSGMYKKSYDDPYYNDLIVKNLSDKIVKKLFSYRTLNIFNGSPVIGDGITLEYAWQNHTEYPTIKLYTKTVSKEQEKVNTVINQSTQDSQINIQKNITSREFDQSAASETNTQNIYNNININQIMDRVYKSIEEKLRFERIKKGFV